MDPDAAPPSPSATALPFSSPRSPLLSRRPRLGIFSKTLFHSPEVHFTFPLRIRDWAKQDVAFIGDSFVHIKQVQNDGRFRHVASKTDFPARIRAAQVIGSTNGDRQLSDDNALQKHAHVLLLTLDSNDLAFVTMSTDDSRGDVFLTSALPLVPQPSVGLESGRYLAVDPFSRAVATAAASRMLEVFEMLPRSDWPATTASAVAHRWIFDTEMKISKIDFLYPPHSRASSIYLLVVGYELKHGARAHRLHARVYEWEHLSSDGPSVLPQTLPKEFVKGHSIPLLLIPLRKFPGGFLLGCERTIALYFDTHLGNIVYGRTHLMTDRICSETLHERYENVGTSLSMPLWKAWASPLRNDLTVDKRDQKRPLTTEHLYIAREDGAVCYLGIDKDGDMTTSFAGWLTGNIETAFNHDGRSREPPDQHGRTRGQPDGLVYGGALSDGGAYTAGLGFRSADGHDPRSREKAMSFLQTETFYNWAPFTDIATELDLDSPSANTKLLGTSGKAPYGALCQLRFGCETIVQHLIVLGETGTSVVATKLWPFETFNGKRAVLLSSPDCTQLVYDLHALGDPSLHSVSEAETLDAARITLPSLSGPEGDLLIRVDSSTLSLLLLGWNARDERPAFRNIHVLPLADAVLSAIEPKNGLVLVANSTTVSLYFVDTSAPKPSFRIAGTQLDLDSEPTAATFFSVTASTLGYPVPIYASVATSSGDVLIFSVSQSDGLVHVFQERPDKTVPCSSIAAVPILDRPNKARLICGLRDGNIRILTLSMSTERKAFSLESTRSVSIGLTPVIVQASPDDSRSVLILCEYRAVFLQFASGPSEELIIHNVHFMNHADRSYTPRELSAVSFMRESSVAPENIVAATGTAIFSGVLGPTPKALPLRLPVPGSPNRTFYSERLKAFFVASTVSHVHERKRYSISTIFLVDPDKSSDAKPLGLFQCYPGETITCMLEWKFVRSSSGESASTKTFHHVVVTTVDTGPTQTKGGSVRFFKMTRDDNTGQPGLVLKKIFREDKPVYSMCQFDNDTLIYSCGDMIKFRKYSVDSGRDVRCILEKPKTENPGVYITARNPFIFVSTRHGSFRTYRFDANSGEMTPITADDRARNGLAHNIFPVPPDFRSQSSGLAMFTDMTASVIGQLQPPIASHSPVSMQVLPPSFEAALPVSITRLIQAHVRPPWKLSFSSQRQERLFKQHIHVRDVFGTATNGSFWSFDVLSEPAWRLLRFVQNLCLRDARVCPTLGGVATGFDGHVEPAWQSPRDSHVDGDIFERLVLRPDAAMLLGDMLNKDPDDQTEDQDYRDASSRKARFRELADEVFGDSPVVDARDSLDSIRPAVGELSLSDDGSSAVLDRLTSLAVQDTLDFATKLIEMPF